MKKKIIIRILAIFGILLVSSLVVYYQVSFKVLDNETAVENLAKNLNYLNSELSMEIQSLNVEIEKLKSVNQQLISKNDELSFQMNELKELEQLQQSEMFPPYIAYGYLEKPNFYVFVEKETQIKMLPYDHAQNINGIFANSLIKVLDKAQVQTGEDFANNRFWFYVEIEVYDTPLNQRGWIRVEETEQYTLENLVKVSGPIRIEDGSKIYESNNPPVDEADNHILAENEFGRIEEYREEFVLINASGGRSFWTKKDNIIFPPFEE